MNFERPVRKSRGVPMTPLIDVVFLLLIFFMLSTSFVRTESLELLLPEKGGDVIETNKVMQIYVTRDNQIYIDHRPMDEKMMIDALQRKLEKMPDVNILLLSGPDVNVQQLVGIMDQIYLVGGKNLSVSHWEPKKDK